eukprot:gene6369-6862_t
MDNYTGRQVSLSYSDPAEIVQLIRKDGVDENYTILDVRDEDEYYGGHIVGAKNHPSGYWSDYTKQRGPTCARILADNLERYLLEAPREKIPKIRVLSGGYAKFSSRYDSSPDLFNDK